MSYQRRWHSLQAIVLVVALARWPAPSAAQPEVSTAAPSTPAESQQMFDVNEDLRFEQLLSEPEIAQPVFLNFDERGRMWVVEYRQYPQPAGLKTVSRDKYYRSVFDKIPPAPPHHDRGADRISIHEDTNGDGNYDQHKVFIDGLNICTAIEHGRGGHWVLNPPYLLFYPDTNQDDVPDGDPEVRLRGFGLEDTHSVANSLRWGPDGWLYAAQGSTVSGHIVRPESDEPPIHSMGQLIWRYHPETRQYEIFAEGGGNAFGVELDSQGRIYSGHNGGDTRGFHYMQGAYLQKGFSKHGPLSNPFAFGYFPPMQHHQVPRFTHNFVIYEQGRGLPEHYHGKLFGVEPLQGQIVQAEIMPQGSTFQTKDIDRPVTSRDEWFRPVDIKLGPDAAIYVCDWYDSQVSHLRHTDGTLDKSNGRVYRLSSAEHESGKALDLGKLTIAELAKQFDSKNRWLRQTALRVLGDRRAEVGNEIVADWVEEIDTLPSAHRQQAQRRLELLWAVHLVRGMSDEDFTHFLENGNPLVRLWSIRLACDDGRISRSSANLLAELAATEGNREVRCQIACSAKRLPARQALPIVRSLLQHDADLNDPRQPLLIWWAIESKCEADADEVLAFWEDLQALQKRPLVASSIGEKLMRRFAAAGSRSDLLRCAKLFEHSLDQGIARVLLAGFQAGVQGRSIANLPTETMEALAATGIRSLPLELRRREPAAIAESLQVIVDNGAKSTERIELIHIFGQIREPASVARLLKVLEESEERAVSAAAIAALQVFPLDDIGGQMIAMISQLDEETQHVATTMLTSRETWTLQTLQAIHNHQLDKDLLDRNALQRAVTHPSATIHQLVTDIYGSIAGGTNEQMVADINQFLAELQEGKADRYSGKRLFNEQCAKCHRLFESAIDSGQFGDIGPDLTSYQRTDLRNLLINIVNPNAEIREGFQQLLIQTTNGRIVTGFKQDEDNRVVVLRGADGESIVVSKADIELMQGLPTSLMPEGILQKLTTQQRRDLIAYLQSTQPLND